MWPLILKITLQVLAVGLALLLGGLDYWWHDKRTKRFKQGRKIFIATSILFLLGSIVATVADDINNNQKEESLRSQLAKVQEQNDGLQKGIAVLSDRSSEMLSEQRGSFVSIFDEQKKSVLTTTEKIRGATRQLNSGINDSINQQRYLLNQQGYLLEQQEDTFRHLTSGDSFCYVTATFFDENNGHLALRCEGELPLFDVSVEVLEEREDAPKSQSNVPISKDDFYYTLRNTKHYTIGTTQGENIVHPIDVLDLTGPKKKEYSININSRFRLFHQVLKLAKVNTQWLVASRVYGIYPQSGGEHRLLKQYIDEGFPTDPHGEIK